MIVTPKPNASKWVRNRIKQWGPFDEIRRDATDIFLRGITPKPNGEFWVGWMSLAQVILEMAQDEPR